MTRIKVHLAVLVVALSAGAAAKASALSHAAPVMPLPTPIVQQFAPPAAVAGQCSEDMTIAQLSPLQFGLISVAHDAGGVVIVSPGGTAATLGDVAAGSGATAAAIRICGAPNEEFVMRIEPGHIALLGSDSVARAYMVRDLEASATGAQIHPTGDGQWQGVLGARGTAEIRIGGSLTIPAHQTEGTYSARLKIRVDRLR